MSNNPNGIGASIARAIKGTAVEVRWAPQLTVTVDGTVLQGVQAADFHQTGENGNTGDVLVLVFQGSPTSPRSSQVGRRISGTAINASGDGITATLAAVA